ncbi:uncharacterized protein EMH_0003600 [Eimeria mitis]|uniref:Uncharacterized protein n=1 Tax=Eimeria mitis TaxID=44415 RepID=U6JZ93_9EIME|nr:uncharacterized protein EMH_0003600 [Eimeria mitis]CDJ29347.1 hypothetical protein, conserved [Eimeria mitis]
MGPSSRSTRNGSAVPPKSSPVPLPSAHNGGRSNSNNQTHVPQLDLAHAAEVAAARQGAPWVQGPLASAMDTTRSQQCANCSDCMLPCRVFLGLSAPKAIKPPAPKPAAPKQTCPPLRPLGPEAAGLPRPGRSVSSGRLPAGTATSFPRQPGLIGTVPVVLSSTAVPRVPERGRSPVSQTAAAGAAQMSSFTQAQQTQPSPQYPLVRAAVVPFSKPGEGPFVAPVLRAQAPTPVISTAQSVQGVAPSGQLPAYIIQVPCVKTPTETAAPAATAAAAAGRAAGTGTVVGTGAATQPTVSYAAFAAQNNGGGQMACLVGPNGQIYLKSNAASSSGNATPASEQRSISCNSPSSGGRSPSGRGARAPIPVLVMQGRSQSVAPPVPRVQTILGSKPDAAHDETGMATEKVRTPGREAENIVESQLPIELDTSLRDVLDGQMLSSRSRLLAMELKAAREHCKAIQEGFKEETKHLKEENERLLSIVESIQRRIEDLQLQLAASRKAPASGEVPVDVCSGLISDIIDSRAGVKLAKDLSELESRDESSSSKTGDAKILAAASQSFGRSAVPETKDQATESGSPDEGGRPIRGKLRS